MRRACLFLSITLLLSLLLTACGGGDDDDSTQMPNATATGQGDPAMTATTEGSEEQTSSSAEATGTTSEGVPPVAEPTATPSGPTFPPNELGQIPILEYHHLGPEPAQFIRTPDQFRGDLQWLYDNGFYVVNLNDILNDTLDVPAGKRPVALTFDDSPSTQFSLIPLSDGRLAIDPNCAIGIMEHFFIEHPDFGRGGHFAVLPEFFFDWEPQIGHPEQTQYIQEKFEWLVAHGYEIGNHTLDHVDLSTLTNDEIMYQLAGANQAIHEILPDEPVEVVTLPYGMYPAGGDDTLFRGFDYQGQHYAYTAALLVGANPTVSPLSTEYDPYATARIQAFDEELDKWFEIFTEQPGILYVSDGDPNTVTVPNDLHPWIVGTLDMSKLGNRQLVRY